MTREKILSELSYGKTALTVWCRILRRDGELRLEAVGIVLMRGGSWGRPLGPILGETW